MKDERNLFEYNSHDAPVFYAFVGAGPSGAEREREREYKERDSRRSARGSSELPFKFSNFHAARISAFGAAISKYRARSEKEITINSL